VIVEDSLRQAQADNGASQTEPVARAALGKEGHAA
jgi:hypothetical protein